MTMKYTDRTGQRRVARCKKCMYWEKPCHSRIMRGIAIGTCQLNPVHEKTDDDHVCGRFGIGGGEAGGNHAAHGVTDDCGSLDSQFIQ